MPQQVLEEDLDRDRGAIEVDPIAECREPEDVWLAGPETGPGPEGIHPSHASVLPLHRYTRSMEAYPELPTRAVGAP